MKTTILSLVVLLSVAKAAPVASPNLPGDTTSYIWLGTTAAPWSPQPTDNAASPAAQQPMAAPAPTDPVNTPYPTASSDKPLEASPKSKPNPSSGTPPPSPSPPAQPPSCPGMGVMLKNARKQKETYYFYNNIANGDGTAEPQMKFDLYTKKVELAAGEEQYVPLDENFKGRIQRGNELGGTWAEFQTKATDGAKDNAAHGDISLQQGCDGAATIGSTCAPGATCELNDIGGFDWDPFVGAPQDAFWPKPDGRKLLDTTVTNWERKEVNKATVDWLYSRVGQINAYIEGGTGTRDIASKNGCLAVVFYEF